jgi:hypothetical protein
MESGYEIFIGLWNRWGSGSSQWYLVLPSRLLMNQRLRFNKKKNPLNKNQGWEPMHQKYKANENTSRHNPKKKQKQTINKNQVKTKENVVVRATKVLGYNL